MPPTTNDDNVHKQSHSRKLPSCIDRHVTNRIRLFYLSTYVKQISDRFLSCTGGYTVGRRRRCTGRAGFLPALAAPTRKSTRPDAATGPPRPALKTQGLTPHPTRSTQPTKLIPKIPAWDTCPHLPSKAANVTTATPSGLYCSGSNPQTHIRFPHQQRRPPHRTHGAPRQIRARQHDPLICSPSPPVQPQEGGGGLHPGTARSDLFRLP